MAGSRPVSDMIGSSNRLGSGPRNTSYAGGNTSAVGVETTQPVLLEQAFRTWRRSDPVLSLKSLLAQSAVRLAVAFRQTPPSTSGRLSCTVTSTKQHPEYDMASELRTLVELSRTLGEPSRDLVILAEGNTSIRTDPDRMLVKASGSQLGNAAGEDFVDVDTRTMLDLVNDEAAGEDDVERVFGELGRGGKRPSVEAMLHAICLSVGGASVVGHTHPVPVNIVLCSPHAERMSSDVLFPEQVVILGRKPVFVPYVDPGLTLARAVQQEMLRHIELDGAPPKVIYLGNHGIFALGESAAEVLQITAMAVKVSRILGGAITIGGVRTLSGNDVARIDGRPDEIHRRQVLADTWQRAGRQPGGSHA